MKYPLTNALLFLLVTLPTSACNRASNAPDKPVPKNLAGDPKINFYKGPADGQKITLHLQGGFTGERIEILYNDIPLYHGDPKTTPTLGLATRVQFTIGKEETGKLMMRTKQEQSSTTFTWKKGAHIAINLGDKIHWEQAEEPWMYK